MTQAWGHFITGGTENPLDGFRWRDWGDDTMRTTVKIAGALLLGLTIADVSFGGSAVAQSLIDLFPGGQQNVNYIFLSVFGANELSRGEALKLQIQEHSRGARDGLREGDASKFYRNRALLRRDIREPGIAARNRRLAKHLLAVLPAKFEEGVAFLRDDGTIAGDPDPRIRAPLVWDRYSSEAGDGDAH